MTSFKNFPLFRQFSTAIQGKIQYLYGINPIELAFAANRREIHSLILSDSQTVKTSYRATKIINLAQQRKIPIIFNSKDKMNKLVKDQPHQNIIIKCSPLSPSPALNVQQYLEGIYVMCDKISDPQNFGSIIRSSLFYGAKNLFTSKKYSSPLNSTVSKASAGALQLMQIHTISKQQQFLKYWSQSQGLVISTSVSNQTTQPITPHECKVFIQQNKAKFKKILLIIGSQGYGVSPHLARNSNISICIDRTGQLDYPFNLVDSLNVNSALSSILYQLTRKK